MYYCVPTSSFILSRELVREEFVRHSHTAH